MQIEVLETVLSHLKRGKKSLWGKNHPATKEDHVRSSFRAETATHFFFPQKLPV